MEFKRTAEPIFTADFWNDIADGGHIKPELLLVNEHAEKVRSAIDTLKEFQNAMEKNELFIKM